MKKHLIKTAGIILGIGISLSSPIITHADGITKGNIVSYSTIDNEIKKEENSLYVLDKKTYEDILKSKTAIIENKNRFLVVDSENIKNEELEEIKKYKSVYTFGESIGILEKLSNFKGNINEKNAKDFYLEEAKNNEENSFIFVHEDSFSGLFIATQLNINDDKNIVLINETLEERTFNLLKENGNNKSAIFIDGEKSIHEKTKKTILTKMSNEKYEMSNSILEKEKKGEEVDFSFLSNLNKKEENISVDSSKLKSYSIDKIKEKGEQRENFLYKKSKIIILEENSSLSSNESIKQETEKDKENNYYLTLTHANSVDLETKEEGKEYFLPITDSLINNVMEGDYGNGQERINKLENLGYNYEEVQNKIDKMQEERASQASILAKRNSNSIQRSSLSYNSSKTEVFINQALKMKGWGYSQSKRMQVGFADCSSIVVRALIDSGLTNDTSNLTTRSIFSDSRFYEIPMSEIKRGDILWYSGHMEIYMGGNSTFGAFREGKHAGYASNINRFNKAFRIK